MSSFGVKDKHTELHREGVGEDVVHSDTPTNHIHLKQGLKDL